jgi:hypothetical protein
VDPLHVYFELSMFTVRVQHRVVAVTTTG